MKNGNTLLQDNKGPAAYMAGEEAHWLFRTLVRQWTVRQTAGVPDRNTGLVPLVD